jgi:AcrR family transcriptional regulator
LGRPVTIDDEKLLEAAREVFLSKGAAATTQEVARKAGVSQASVFKRYKTKQALFLAAMHAHRRRLDWLAALQKRTPEVGLRQAMIDVGVEMIGFLEKIFPLVLVSWSNRGEFGFDKGTRRSGPAGGIEQLTQFLQTEIDAGRLNQLDPWSVVRAFAGSLHSYVLMSLVTKNGIGPNWNARAYVTGVVNVLWEGLTPRPLTAERPAAPRSRQR